MKLQKDMDYIFYRFRCVHSISVIPALTTQYMSIWRQKFGVMSLQIQRKGIFCEGWEMITRGNFVIDSTNLFSF